MRKIAACYIIFSLTGKRCGGQEKRESKTLTTAVIDLTAALVEARTKERE